VNIAQYYLTSGNMAPRLGNAHSTIVPYQAFEAKDGHIILAIGNDGQFLRFCELVGKQDWAQDPKFSTNSARVANRDELVPLIADIIATRNIEDWHESLSQVDVPCGPVNTMDKTFDMEQIAARQMKIKMKHTLKDDDIDLVGSPIKMSETPPSYDLPPPVCGAHTNDILTNMLKLSPEEIAGLAEKKII
jgi:crotonobetainyl-CoA:carnitine CoA-transferase CaiB-like acyl-CoA transferase